jgi:hypothetical protein
MLELLVAMALGLLLLGAAAQLFKAGMTTSTLVSNRSEMQQELRSAIDLIAKDISMAGAGLPSGGIQLPTGAGATPSIVACSQTPTCYLNTNTYANGTVGTAPAVTISNYMYGILPGSNNGMEKGGPSNVAATGKVPDSLTTAYIDFGPQFNVFSAAFQNANGTVLTLTAPTPMPTGVNTATDSGTGIKVGDLLMVTTSLGTAVGEVSIVTPLNTTGATITFSNLDPLNINQTGATTGNMKKIVPLPAPPLPVVPPATQPSVTVQRLLVVTYFIEVPTNGTPRLMRQVNGNPAQPVADNIIDMQFTYDLCDSGYTVAACATTPDPIAVYQSPIQIHKVNISLMGQSLVNNGKNSQSMLLSTAVSARNLTFKDRYK